MAVVSGAGAAVFSGAGYQARVAAYAIVTALCDVECIFSPNLKISTIGFETAECIDDINIALTNNSFIYIQAKAKIDFSLSTDGNFRSVLKQFTSQAVTNRGLADRYILVTSSRSSKKITHDLRAALEAFNKSPKSEFFRDQPKVLTQIIYELRSLIGSLLIELGQVNDLEKVDQIILQCSVVVLDIDSGDSLEQATILVLEAKKYLAASAIWGKIVSDCIAHAKARHTLKLSDLVNTYKKYINSERGVSKQVSEELIKVEFGNIHFNVGREVMLCEVPEGFHPDLESGVTIFEFYRFDKNCEKRILVNDDSIKLSNGGTIPLIRRAATYSGLIRLIESDPYLKGDSLVAVYPIDSDDDFELGHCAEIHRSLLKEAIENSSNLLQCFHCGQAIFEKEPSLIEVDRESDLIVAMSHKRCMVPSDRLLGSASSDLFEQHPELVNFDINGWFRAAHGGQLGLPDSQLLKTSAILAWSGLTPKGPLGQYIIEIQLANGDSEIVTLRNGVHRFTKAEVDRKAEELNQGIKNAISKRDPMCYTEQTKAYGNQSALRKQFGGKERIIQVETASVRNYEERIAARYAIPGNWYAPLLYLRAVDTGLPLIINNTLPLIKDPLKLRNYLENWSEVGISIPEYETVCIFNDDEFDEFMRWIEYEPWHAVIEPIFDPEDNSLASGLPLRSVEAILSFDH